MNNPVVLVYEKDVSSSASSWKQRECFQEDEEKVVETSADAFRLARPINANESPVVRRETRMQGAQQDSTIS